MEKKLADLTTLVADLQQKLDQVQANTTSTIQSTVQKSIAEQQAALDQKYLAMFASINTHLQNITSQLSTKSSASESNTRPIDADPPLDVTQAKKLPCFLSPTLASVQRSIKSTLSALPSSQSQAAPSSDVLPTHVE